HLRLHRLQMRLNSLVAFGNFAKTSASSIQGAVPKYRSMSSVNRRISENGFKLNRLPRNSGSSKVGYFASSCFSGVGFLILTSDIVMDLLAHVCRGATFRRINRRHTEPPHRPR